MPALPPINRDKFNQQKLGYFGKFGSGGNVEVTYIQTVLDFDFLDKITLIEHIKGSDRWDVQDLFQRNVDDVRVSKEIFPFFQNSETIKFFAPLALVLLPIDGNEINPQLDELKTKDLSLPEYFTSKDLILVCVLIKGRTFKNFSIVPSTWYRANEFLTL